MSNNWVQTNETVLSANDKIKALLKISHRLVLVQQQELELLRNDNHKTKHMNYIDQLYQHYVVLGLPKMYLTS